MTHAFYLALAMAAFALGLCLGVWTQRATPGAARPLRYAFWGALASATCRHELLRPLCDWTDRKALEAWLGGSSRSGGRS